MNFLCSTADIQSPFPEIEKHKTKNGWFLYLDKGWTKTDNYYYKGFSSSWCKIFVDPIVRIETNKLRDFPIYYNEDSTSNFSKLDNILPVDGILEIDDKIHISYKENFYPRITHKHQTFKECHDLLYDALIENIGTFASTNNDTVYIPLQGGIDTLTVRSVFDFLNVKYELFEMPKENPISSQLHSELAKKNWGFTQVKETQGVIVTGFYGDEWVLRNPVYVHMALSLRGVNLTKEFDKIENCYMKWFFESSSYRGKCNKPSTETLDEIIRKLCNDFQIWHLNNTKIFSPLKHLSLLTLLSADTQTMLDQVTDAKLSKSIIKY
mgnify:CR=1 FL=1